MTTPEPTTDIARQVPQAITDPDSGELIDRADVERVAVVAQRLKEYQDAYKDAAAWCRDVLIEAADERSDWSFTAGGVKVSVDPPSLADITWDIDELAKLEGLLPPERYAELVQTVVSYKPQTVKLKALARRAGPDSEVGRIILQAEQRRSKPRSVRVSS